MRLIAKIFFTLSLVGAAVITAAGQATNPPGVSQTAPPPSTSTSPNVNTFGLVATAVALPGGKQTIAATVDGFTFTPTPNFDLREDTLLAPSDFLTGWFGGFNYRLPALSTALNNVSPNLNGYSFQFYFTGSVGVVRESMNTPTVSHYAFLAGGGVTYKLSAGGMWTLGAEARYAKIPGLANNTAIIALGPAIHF